MRILYVIRRPVFLANIKDNNYYNWHRSMQCSYYFLVFRYHEYDFGNLGLHIIILILYILRIKPVPLAELVATLPTRLRPLILSDNIPTRSFALLSHRLPSSQPVAYIIARLRLALFSSTLKKNSS